MKKIQVFGIFLLLTILSSVQLFGHACHDPWRPNPSNPGSSSGSVTPPPPPPPPPNPPTISGGNDGGTGSATSRTAVSTVPQAGSGLGLVNISGGKEVGVFPDLKGFKLVNGKGRFKVSVENKGSRDMFEVTLKIVNTAFEAETDPKSIMRLASGENAEFTVKITSKIEIKDVKDKVGFKVLSRNKEVYSGTIDKLTTEAAKGK
ncbi:MAG: hypothetical protein A2231_00425 [Candidatus Firestonebacteria bacterium RIFOXYA2_FULL_40_8]|nr:MAG: hypothetical protein A2231_00425 [Candidatus Firestonebacteria bacterium RIFOXYA2_FULL_40_8]